MAFDKFLIAPLNEGLRRDVKPWLIPEDAFEELNNAYIFRGRVQKRFGAQELGTGDGTDRALPSRLRIFLNNTNGAGNITGTIPTAFGGGVIAAVGQQFSIGEEVFTVNALGAPATMLTTGAATTHTFNTTTGVYDIKGAAALTACYFYPSTPVMGFAAFETTNINNETVFAFDRNFAYKYNGTSWVRSTAGTSTWNSDDKEFFWAENFRGITSDITLLFVTNYNRTDQMRYWNGATWTAFNPAFSNVAGNTIESCRIIISFQNRLLLMNTHEIVGGNPKTFVNRVRFSQNGTPLPSVPEPWPWYEQTVKAGKGGFLDGPVQEAIVTARVIRNRLIVFFERSTFELVWVGDGQNPFIWQRINSVLGAESTFSSVVFDKAILAIGDTGIHACNGANVERIDAKIPDEVFNIHNKDSGPLRVHGIKDYYSEMVYWAVPNNSNYYGFPNRILAYNYRNNSWAFFDDSITAFGYMWGQQGETWATWDTPWQGDMTKWNDGTDVTHFRYVVAGNQQGYTFVIAREFFKNSLSLHITNITAASGVPTFTCINHNLKTGDWIYIDEIVDDAGNFDDLNDNHYGVIRLTNNTFQISGSPSVAGTYKGGGIARLVSKIDIKTKEFNFYLNKGTNLYLSKSDFYVRSTQEGEVTVDYFASSSRLPIIESTGAPGIILGTSVLDLAPIDGTLESTQDRFWHAVYVQTQGESIQLRFYWDNDQMKSLTIPYEDFELHGMLFHTMPTQEL